MNGASCRRHFQNYIQWSKQDNLKHTSQCRDEITYCTTTAYCIRCTTHYFLLRIEIQEAWRSEQRSLLGRVLVMQTSCLCFSIQYYNINIVMQIDTQCTALLNSIGANVSTKHKTRFLPFITSQVRSRIFVGWQYYTSIVVARPFLFAIMTELGSCAVYACSPRFSRLVSSWSNKVGWEANKQLFILFTPCTHSSSVHTLLPHPAGDELWHESLHTIF